MQINFFGSQPSAEDERGRRLNEGLRSTQALKSSLSSSAPINNQIGHFLAAKMCRVETERPPEAQPKQMKKTLVPLVSGQWQPFGRHATSSGVRLVQISTRRREQQLRAQTKRVDRSHRRLRPRTNRLSSFSLNSFDQLEKFRIWAAGDKRETAKVAKEKQLETSRETMAAELKSIQPIEDGGEWAVHVPHTASAGWYQGRPPSECHVNNQMPVWSRAKWPHQDELRAHFPFN